MCRPLVAVGRRFRHTVFVAGDESTADAFFAELLKAGESQAKIRELMARASPEEAVLIGLLRRGVPVSFLEFLGTSCPWSERPRILGGVVLSPRAPRSLALRLLPSLYWRDLAEAARSPRLEGPVRVRAEGLLKERLEELRLGERITLAKIATPPILVLLLAQGDPKIVGAALLNPRLREEDLLIEVKKDTAPLSLIEEVAASSRWREAYRVRLALVLQPRTPLATALSQISSLIRADLLRVAEAPGLRPLIQAAARRVAGENPEPTEI